MTVSRWHARSAPNTTHRRKCQAWLGSARLSRRLCLLDATAQAISNATDTIVSVEAQLGAYLKFTRFCPSVVWYMDIVGNSTTYLKQTHVCELSFVAA